MKIFHTADWHVGKMLMGKRLIDDQKEVLDKLIEKVRQEDPDVVIIAGDIYDKSIPPIEAISLLNQTLYKMVLELDKKVIMVSGNHDSPDRLSFGSDILSSKGLHIVSSLEGITEPIVMTDEFGPVNFYAVPYMTPMKGRSILKEEIESHDELVKSIMDRISEKMDKSERNVCVYHGFVVNEFEEVTESESERPLSIGGSDCVSAGYFEDFDYVALGHLHGPQKVKLDKIRYSGSLMKYSFSEQHQKKGVVEINLEDKGDVQIGFHEIYPERDMRVLEGNLEELLAQDATDDYILARLKMEAAVFAPKEKLDRVFCNLLRLEIVREISLQGERKSDIKSGFIRKDVIGLFRDFYEDVTNRQLSEEKAEKLASIVRGINLSGEEHE